MSGVELLRAGFRAEADMLMPLEVYATRMARDATVFFEIASTAGVPDLVSLVLDTAAIEARVETCALVEQTSIRVIATASRARRPLERVWSAQQLSDLAAVSPQHFRRSVAPRLVGGGHLIPDGPGWRLVYQYRSLARKVVTIEAKLRDWRGALGQASRHAAIADAAWVALDAGATGAAQRHENWFSTYGVGLLAVSEDGRVVKLIAPRKGRSRRLGRELLVERAVALLRDGRRSGELPVVFGERLVATRGADPRLVGAAGR